MTLHSPDTTEKTKPANINEKYTVQYSWTAIFRVNMLCAAFLRITVRGLLGANHLTFEVGVGGGQLEDFSLAKTFFPN